jgi:hypothetical protein
MVPADPARVVAGPLDPDLEVLRSALRPHRRRLWTRRLVRRAFVAAAVVAVAELALWVVARFVALEAAPIAGAAIPIVVMAGLLVASLRARPGLGETALAVDVEAGLGDRVSSAFELAVAEPALAGPATPASNEAPAAEAGVHEAFVRRQRHDAVRALGATPVQLFRPHVSRTPALVAVMAGLLIVPAVLIPNPQDLVMPGPRVSQAAEEQACCIEEVA